MTKYLAIEFSNAFVNRYRDIRDIYNNELMHTALPYFDGKPDRYNEYPLWFIHLNNILDGKLTVKLVDSVQEAINFIVAHKPEFVLFSELEVTIDAILEVVKHKYEDPNVKFIIGARNKHHYPNNVITVSTIDELNKKFNFNRTPVLRIPAGSHFNDRMPVRINITNNCNYNCKFCVNKRGVTRVNADIINKWFGLYHNCKYVYIGDCTFGQDLEYELTMLNSNKQGREFIVQTNAKIVVNSNNLKKWYDVGIRYVELGVETFNDSILKQYNKPSSVADNIQAIRELNLIGIKVIPNIMIGIKGEKYTHYSNTMKALDKLIANNYIYYLNLFFFSDYDSDNPFDRSELYLHKSWITTPTDKCKLEEFANWLYKTNYILLNKCSYGEWVSKWSNT